MFQEKHNETVVEEVTPILEIVTLAMATQIFGTMAKRTPHVHHGYSIREKEVHYDQEAT